MEILWREVFIMEGKKTFGGIIGEIVGVFGNFEQERDIFFGLAADASKRSFEAIVGRMLLFVFCFICKNWV